jgi:hypothetical protein
MEPRTSPIETVEGFPLHALRIDPEIQPRVHLNPSVIEDYATLYHEAEDGEEPLPPLDVFEIDKLYFLVDGFHRVEAAKHAKRTQLTCRFHQGTRQEAIRYAARANLRHGLRYTSADLQQVLERFLNDPEMAQRSDRDLATEIGVSHMTVNRARHRREAVEVLEQAWQAAEPATPMKSERQRYQHQVATFLEVDPATVTRVAGRLQHVLEHPVATLARFITDSNMSLTEAKTLLGERLKREASQAERTAERRREERAQQQAAQARWEEKQTREAETRQRLRAGEHLLTTLTAFVALGDQGQDPPGVYRAHYTIPQMLKSLPRQQVPKVTTLLQQAATVVQQLTDAVTAHQTRPTRQARRTKAATNDAVAEIEPLAADSTRAPEAKAEPSDAPQKAWCLWCGMTIRTAEDEVQHQAQCTAPKTPEEHAAYIAQHYGTPPPHSSPQGRRSRRQQSSGA